jgi:hypothetical protein
MLDSEVEAEGTVLTVLQVRVKEVILISIQGHLPNDTRQ